MGDVIMNTTTLQPTLTAAEVRRQAEAMCVVVERRISLTCCLDGRLWAASVEVKGSGANRKRNLRSVSAIASTPTVAVEQLCAKLDAEPQAQEMFDGPSDFDSNWSYDIDR